MNQNTNESLEKDVQKEASSASKSPQNFPSKLTWDTFWTQLSESLDDDIIQYHKVSGKDFLGGKCTISAMKKGIFKRSFLNIEADLYFTADSEEEAVKRTVIRKCPFENFQNEPETQKHLKMIENESATFDIASPL